MKTAKELADELENLWSEHVNKLRILPGAAPDQNVAQILLAAIFNIPATIERLREVERMREALAFYANPENWDDDTWNVRCIIRDEYGDAGKRARAALRPLPPTDIAGEAPAEPVREDDRDLI